MRLIDKYRERVKDRPDREHQQALVRLCAVSVIFVYISVMMMFGKLDHESLLYVSIALIGAIGIFSHIMYSPGKNVARRIFAMILDPVTFTLYLNTANDKAALFLFLYVWVTVGHGFRYGYKYLYLAAVINTFIFALMVVNNSYWQQNIFMSLGVIILISAVTFYIGSLLKQLSSANEQLEKNATHDMLTGLANRRLLMDRLKESLVDGQQRHKPVALIYFDLDGFKAVNDQFGHQSGDDLLKLVAVNVKTCIKELDTFARLGGDEFVIVLNSLTKTADSKSIADTILKKIESIKEVNGQQIKISASIGVVELNLLKFMTDELHGEPESLIKQADEAMYKAKKSGKGKIEYREFQ